MRRIPGVDGLRSIAITLVIFQHYVFVYLLNIPSNIGEIGVSIFFVISGYLITSILLHERDAPLPIVQKLMRFYVRRTVRIFPIYYLTISIGVFSGIYWFSKINPLWYYGYAANWLMVIRNSFTGYTGHFWSLAVEEQFYLVWPLLIFSLPKRMIPATIGFCISVGVATYCVAPLLHLSQTQLYVITFTHLDALGSGALLAYVHRNYPDTWSIDVRSAFWPLLTIFVVAFAVNQTYEQDLRSPSNLSMVWGSTLLTAAAIHAFWSERIPALTVFFEMPVLRWTGRTSYGLYLYHALVPEMFVGTRFSPLLPPTIERIAVYFTGSLILTAMSWILIEAPLNNQKERTVNFVDRILRGRIAARGKLG